MKNKKDLKKIALLGLASGMFITAQSSAEAASIEDTSQNKLFENLLAASCKSPNGCSTLNRKCGANCSALHRKCGGPNGCNTLTAIRDVPDRPTNTADLTAEEKANLGNVGYKLMSEKELLMELDNKGTENYNKLDAKGKETARYVASQRCAGTNMCAGLNACQTDKNKCAGQGACKGQGKCAIADKNLAVKIVLAKMTGKRINAAQK